MSLFRLVFPLVGMPLTARIPDPTKEPLDDNSDMPYGHMLLPQTREAPNRPSFFREKNWNVVD